MPKTSDDKSAFSILSKRDLMKQLKDIIINKDFAKGRFSKHEFQVFGYYLASQLDDLKHKSLYMKLAKEEKREKLEEALRFVKESNPRSKAKLFMWKLKDLGK